MTQDISESKLQDHTEPSADPLDFAKETARKMLSDDMLMASHSDLEEFAGVQSQEWARRLVEENLRLRALIEENRERANAKGKSHK